MPRGRKPTVARTSSANQATLSFNNKVTKPSTRAQREEHAARTKKLSHLEGTLTHEEPELADVDVTAEPEATDFQIEDEDVSEIEQAVEQADPEPSRATTISKVRASKAKDDRELAADKITDAQLKKYWQREEDSRLAPRVHQSQVPLHEKILRHFDLSSQYGPCIGIPRLTRWRRANTLKLQPPLEVLAVLLREEEGTVNAASSAAAKEGIKYSGKGRSQGCGKMAYIDELAGGRTVLVE